MMKVGEWLDEDGFCGVCGINKQGYTLLRGTLTCRNCWEKSKDFIKERENTQI